MAEPRDLDVVVIGGGQAGLAAGFELTRRDLDALVLDAGPETGHSWRTRWDSLRLFTPAEHSSLPGLAFPAPPGHHPGKDEVADYLVSYVDRFDLPVRHRAPVERVGRDGDRFVVTTGADGALGGRVVTARSVVVATGPFQTPAVPRLADGLDGDVLQLHSSHYRRPSQLPSGGTVVVVGAGNSGVQIASELAARCDVHLAEGRSSRFVPQRLAGRDLFWWLTRTGMLTAGPDTRRGRRMQRSELVIGADRRRLQVSVAVHPRVEACSGTAVRFADGRTVTVDAVVWATGFTRSHRFVEVPGALDPTGVIDQRGGLSPVPGLFTVGQPWQRNRASSLLGFVGLDAALVAEAVARRGRGHGPRTAPRQPQTAA
jgi:putative flavoprotein involved in K+ transport